MKPVSAEPAMRRRMMRCLELARKGAGRVAPNPLVGCVIERDGRVIGEGYHRMYGGAHAEIEALRRAGSRAAGATLYVNLEPCNHTGKTPPCTDAILDAGIKTVVVGMRDPNRQVKGGGIRRLRAEGVRIVTPVCKSECAELNGSYLVNVNEGRPYVVVKFAQTLDGFIAQPDGRSKWITTAESRRAAHAMRNAFDAILVGAETVRKDNPSLLPADRARSVPFRLVLTASGALDPRSAIFTDSHRERTRIISTPAGSKSFLRSRSRTRPAPGQILALRPGGNGLINMHALLKTLYRAGVYSILVEGGSHIISRFLDADCADELRIFTAPKILGRGIRAMEGTRAIPLARADRFTIAESAHYGGDAYLRLLRKR